jgi:hypothetical protein
LFSAADIDTGTRFLLKVFSQQWDAAEQRGLPRAQRVLDAGCGVGVIGICVAGTLAQGAQFHVHCQDRDELAKIITEYNAEKNSIPPELLSAHTEPLLGSPKAPRWDIILSNVPAKARKPVLADFILRSAALLNPCGWALIVVVNPLADFFRAQIPQLRYEERGPGHTVFMYGPAAHEGLWGGTQGRRGFLGEYPAYHRLRGDYTMEGITYTLDTIQGLGDFDCPHGTVQVAAKLTTRFIREKAGFARSLLIYEPGQGHFPKWLKEYQAQDQKLDGSSGSFRWVFSSRNILALEASRYNMYPETVLTIPGIDLSINQESLLSALEPGSQGYDLIVGFPQFVAQTDRLIPLWEGIRGLLAQGGVVIIALPASEAERFDRKKPPGFNRLGDCKRHGFRALGYVFP